ncbi:interleukin-31 receptor subunit alpha-like isoform 1-T1 [Fundulus diaphanus]
MLRISLISVVVAAALSVCNGQHEKSCDVFPKDQHIEVGSSVELVCRTSCSSGKIFWTLNEKNLSESLSKSINSTHTVLSLSNFTQSGAVVECRSSHTDQVLGGVIVSTYSKPENIKCVFITKYVPGGIPDVFTCSWSHHMNSTQAIRYTILQYVFDSLNEVCNSEVAQCTIEDSLKVAKMFLQSNGEITVRAKTDAWEAYSEPYKFEPRHIRKINPPERPVITPSSDRLSVGWDSRCGGLSCRCEVRYHKISESNGVTPKYLSRPLSNYSATIEEIESCSNYSISVRCATKEGLWSDWTKERTVLTKLNKSHVRLQLWRKVAEMGENGKRKVHLMWRGIPSTCEEVLTYTIKQIPYKDNTNLRNDTYTPCGASSCDVELDQHAHRLFLTVSVNGALLSDDSVYVPAVEETGLAQVFSIQATAHEGVIQVSWNASEKPTSRFMIDWTHDGNQYHWNESVFTAATLFGLMQRKPYNITVTPLFNDSTGHGTQANQICSSIRVPELVAVRNVEIHSKSAFVNWDTKSQDPCSGVVTYVIFYETQRQPQLNVTVDGDEEGVWLKDLQPNTQYTVYVEATGYNGTTKSKTMFFTTNMFDSKLIKIFSVCGGLLVILVLSLGLACAIQWKKFYEKPVPNPRLSSVAKWLSHNHQKMEGFFQPFKDQAENEVVTDETQRQQGAALTPVCNGKHNHDEKLVVCDPSLSPTPESEPIERFSENSETQLLSSPEGSMVFSSSQSSPYRSQDSVEPLLPRLEKPSRSDLCQKQEKTTPKSVYVSLIMFEQSGAR